MATSQQPDSGSGTDSGETKKTVQVVAYAEDQAYKSERAMADALDARDFYARERRTNRTVELVYEDENGHEHTAPVYPDEMRDALVEADVRSDELTVREEVDVSRPYAHRPGDVADDLRRELGRELPSTLAGGVTCVFGYKWQDDDRETKVRILSDGINYRRVLLHRTERNGRRKYETDRKHLSMAFTIELGPEDSAVVAEWSESVVAEFVKMLAGRDWVWKVRVADCTESIEREGDCFDI